MTAIHRTPENIRQSSKNDPLDELSIVCSRDDSGDTLFDEVSTSRFYNIVEFSNKKIRTCTTKCESGSKKERREYRKIPNLPRRIVEDLANGLTASIIAERLDISKSQVNRYKDAALRLKILVLEVRSSVTFYSKGPRYNLRKEGRWWSKKFEPTLCRVHYGQGNPYVVDVREYRWFDCMPYRQKNGTVIYHPLFDNGISYPGYTIYKRSLHLPDDVLGRSSDVYLEARVKASGDITIFIGPPAIERSFKELEPEDGEEDYRDPYFDLLFYLRYELRNHGGWFFSDFKCHAPLHYAIDAESVRDLCPELLVSVPKLRRRDNEEDLGLYIDKSRPGGELETVHFQMARDILGILDVERRVANGTLKF